MASFGGYPQTINYQNVTVSQGGGGAQNLLINPRGKINQANEADGILSPGQYFCDGWKAGAAGAEVYIDADGFRLISGSILQLVPNILEPTEVIRGNMDAINGSPSISINGGGDNVTAGSGEYIQFEVSGDNSKFTRMILAVGNNLPVYQQQTDELTPCFRFLYIESSSKSHSSWISLTYLHASNSLWGSIEFPTVMHQKPACQIEAISGNLINMEVTQKRINYKYDSSIGISSLIADARP